MSFFEPDPPALPLREPDAADMRHLLDLLSPNPVDTDDLEERDRAAARLDKAGLAGVSHYGFADSFAEKLYFEVDRGWRGELPFTVLVARDGSRKTVTGGLDDPDMVNWLNKIDGK